MTQLSFTKDVAPRVEDRTKFQTIRNNGKTIFKAGDALQLYKGRYAPGERIKMHDAICLSVEPIKIDIQSHNQLHFCNILLNNNLLTPNETEKFALDDGFAIIEKFIKYFKFKDGKPYIGRLIKWGLAFDKLQIGSYYQDENGNRVEIADVEPKTQKLWAWDTNDEEASAELLFDWSGKLIDSDNPKYGDLKWQVAP